MCCMPSAHAYRQWLICCSATLQGLAADQAGMRQGDEILSIDGKSADSLTPFQVSTLLRTPPPTPAPEPSDRPTEPSLSTSANTNSTSSDSNIKDNSTGGSSISWSTLASYVTPAGSKSGSEASSVPPALVEVVHENGELETLRISRGKNAAVANPVGSVSLRGDTGYVKLRTFNARAVPELKVRLCSVHCPAGSPGMQPMIICSSLPCNP